jgi:oligosaccharide repeat unit polymerase
MLTKTETFFALLNEFPHLLIGSGLILMLSIWLMQKALRIFDTQRITIPTLWYLTYLPMIFFPAFLVFYIQPDPYRQTYIFGVVSVLITVPLGIIFANLIFRFGKNELDEYFASPIIEHSSRYMWFVYLLIFLVTFGLVLLYFRSVGTVPLLYMLQNPGQAHELAVLREEAFKLLDPRWSTSDSTLLFYVYLFLRTLVFPFIIVSALGYFLWSRQKKWLILFLGIMIVGGGYAASSIARAPVAALVMRVLFFLYLYKGGKLSKKAIVILILLMLAFPLLVTALAYSSDVGIWTGLSSVINRLFYTPAWGLYYYFEVFPAHHDFLYGQAFLKPILIVLDQPYFYVENYVYLYMSPGGIPSGHENDAFISNLHADFGIIGVLVGGILTGIFMQSLQIYLARKPKNIQNISLYAFFVYAFWVLNSGSVTSVLFVNGVLPVIGLTWAIQAAASFLRGALRNASLRNQSVKISNSPS